MRESKLQRDIRDIIDELDIMVNIVKQQDTVIRRFIKLAEEILGKGGSDSPELTEAKLRCFEKRAANILSDMSARREELDGLRQTAESTAQNANVPHLSMSRGGEVKPLVNDLLSLKQQQAGVIQAHQSIRQGNEAVRQGRAIMVFTVMTIFFLPMSFMTSLFGMNNPELSGSEPDNSSSTQNEPGPPIATSSISGLDDVWDNFWPVTFNRQLKLIGYVSGPTIALALLLALTPMIGAVETGLKCACRIFGYIGRLFWYGCFVAWEVLVVRWKKPPPKPLRFAPLKDERRPDKVTGWLGRRKTAVLEARQRRTGKRNEKRDQPMIRRAMEDARETRRRQEEEEQKKIDRVKAHKWAQETARRQEEEGEQMEIRRTYEQRSM